MSIKRKFGKGNLEYSPFMKVKKITEDIYFKQIKKKGKEKLTESALSERTAPSLDRKLDKESCFQV